MKPLPLHTFSLRLHRRNHQPVITSNGHAEMLPVSCYWFQRKIRLGDEQVGLRHGVDYIGEPGLPIEVIEFGAPERGMENGDVLPLCGSKKQAAIARNGDLLAILPILGNVACSGP